MRDLRRNDQREGRPETLRCVPPDCAKGTNRQVEGDAMKAALYTPEQHSRIQLGIKAERPAEAPSVLRVAITANLVATNAPQLRTIADDAIDEGRITITLDLAHCGYVDARGFGILVASRTG
jgi:hypothetical protein